MALLLRVLALRSGTGGPYRALTASRCTRATSVGWVAPTLAIAATQEALACFDSAMERFFDPWEAQRYESIAVDRARTLTRLGLRDEAEGAWHAIALEGGPHAALAWLHVAKHREHDGRDFRAALQATSKARAIAERSRLFGRRDRLVERDLARRVPRLRRRIAAQPRVGDAGPVR